jgi:hypothetical protein
LDNDTIDLSHVLDTSAGDKIQVENAGGFAKVLVVDNGGAEKASITFSDMTYDLTPGSDLDSLLGKIDPDHH